MDTKNLCAAQNQVFTLITNVLPENTDIGDLAIHNHLHAETMIIYVCSVDWRTEIFHHPSKYQYMMEKLILYITK